ncbi:MAG: YggS family pyridoxal phosphate-dependent enzyme [Eubacteriales bacterium]|nr:YggS family pyridoxal phosphate-dependent enzyme [Eubacteriales bacterium]
MITDNYREIRRKIDEACRRVGRDPEDVLLVAVSKTKPEEDIQTLYDSGVRDFGENYIQELKQKMEDLPGDIRWHMIGHLQRNKVKYIASRVSMIHAVDTLELAKTIEKEGTKNNRVIPVLIEVNVAGEDTKFGVAPEETESLIRQIAGLPHVHVEGLMTSAPYVTDAECNRSVFAQLKQLSVDIEQKNIDNTCMHVLSMGMTNDYEIAVEEGSTMVRVGTAIFGERDYSK